MESCMSQVGGGNDDTSVVGGKACTAFSNYLQPPKRPRDGPVTDASPKRFRSSPDQTVSEGSTPQVWSSPSSPEVSLMNQSNAEIDDANNQKQGSTRTTANQSHSQMVHVFGDDSAPMEGVKDAMVIDEASHQQICYGALCESQASLMSTKGAQTDSNGNTKRYLEFEIKSSSICLVLSSAKKETFAQLDQRTCRALRMLISVPGCRATAIIERKNLMQGRTKPKSNGVVPVSINAYGPASSADQAGDVLSKSSMFLQIPYFLEARYEYFNPQLFRPRGEMQNQTHLVGLTDDDFKAKGISDAVERIFDSLDSPELCSANLPGISRGGLQLGAIKTELRSHQADALAFIQRRENQDLCQGSNSVLRRMAGIEDHISSYATGGILADVMGLGKTLTMISAIAGTADHAAQYMHARKESDAMTDDVIRRSRATLVIVTSAQVLDVWLTELTSHLKPDTLRTCVFHGKDRHRSLAGIIDHDIVLSTYATLTSDLKNRGLLQKVQWYRVVLDEAHWICTQSSNQFIAAQSLNSDRRWCVTGTPIQNRLEDLLSLLKFLHFEPFARTSVFKRHILEPLSRDTQDRAFRLHTLLRAICIRRTDGLLGLPTPRFEQVTLRLNPEERSLYGGVVSKCSRDIDDSISAKEKKLTKYNILFTAIVRLRRICNHGISPVSITGPTVMTPDARSEAELDCEFCQGDDGDKLELFNVGDFCTQCGRNLDSASQGGRGGYHPASETSQYPTLPHLTQQGFLSTKIQTIVDRIGSLQTDSKSLVFSYWTTTLDLLAQQLHSKHIDFVRIDGKVPFNDRLKILDRFRNSAVPVLLISIQTGALGLNLTVANYVHLVEPQWNPSVEEQAIARAVRWGKTRNVTVIRYVVEKSVEENIVNLQKRKKNLAKFTLDGGPRDGASDGLEDLKFVLDFESI